MFIKLIILSNMFWNLLGRLAIKLRIPNMGREKACKNKSPVTIQNSGSFTKAGDFVNRNKKLK